jgi:tRNA1Val (adenine37-N6)-methyltransferase
MSEDIFHFRYFTVHQDKCAMKVGTDAVLLGSWVDPGDARRILDVGTGTGLLALMLAQKSDAMIEGVDIDQGAYLQARENFLLSPWYFQLTPVHASFQEFAVQATPGYDLIVSNPPYFQHASKPSGEARTAARHTDMLAYGELIDGVRKLLHPNGRFCVILPFKEGMDFLDLAQQRGLFCQRLARIKTKPGKPEKRVMIEFGYRFGVMTEEEIVIQEENNRFSDQYIRMTDEYFLNLRSSAPDAP